MYFCNINGFIQIIFFVDIIFFNRIILLEYFSFMCVLLYCSIGILISSYFGFYFIVRIVLAFLVHLRF